MSGSKNKCSVSNDDEEEYIVEDILKRKVQKGKTYYKIKWEGYPFSKCTWEPTQNLNRSLIKRYENSVSKGTPFSETLSDNSSSDEDDVSQNESCNDSTYKSESVDSEIKEILEKTQKNGHVKYKVLYDDENVKWVLPKDIDDKSLLKAFENKMSKGSSKKRKRFVSESGSDSDVVSKQRNLRISSPPASTVSRTSNYRRRRISERNLISKHFDRFFTPEENNLENSPKGTPRSAKSINTRISSRRSKVHNVKEILDHRIVDGRKEYKIRWEEYPSENDSWQAADTFLDQSIIDDYENKLSKSNRLAQLSGSTRNMFDEEEEFLLTKLMKKAKKGKKYTEKEISGILGIHYNNNNEKWYIIQLKNKNVILMHYDDIPAKFRNECLSVSCGRIFD